MLTLQFWKSWLPVYQRLFWTFLIVFLLSVGTALFSFIQNPAPVFTWQELQEMQRQELPVYTFEVAGIDLTVVGENYILFERWAGNPLQINLTALDVYLTFFVAAIVVLLAVITVLPRFWFFAGSGCAAFLISSFRLEALQLFGLENKIPTILMMVLVLSTGLYYQFVKGASFINRVATFGLLSILMGLAILQFSDIPHPLRHLAVNTLPAAIVLLALFIIMVAHEIMAFFIFLVGQGTQNSKSLRHFLIISGIYLLNLWLAYLTKVGWFNWGLAVPPFFLLLVSTILAIGGIRQRQTMYEHIFPVDPFGVYIVLALGTLAIATTGYFFASASDVALISFNDFILYTQIGYGMMFLMYVASNFLTMLSRNFPVYRVLYKPTAMPYFSYRLAGLIFTLAFIFYNRWEVPVNRFISAYYTAVGDLFFVEKNTTLATGYYKRAHFLVPYNKHAATALAELEAARNQTLRERYYLLDANAYRPTEFSLVNASQSYLLQGQTFEEIFLLRKGKQQLPKSGIIKNNLALIYTRMGVLDSAFLLFLEARNDNLTEASAEMNLLGLVARNNLNVNADSIYQAIYSKQVRVKSNAIAIANRQGKLIDIPLELPKDSILNLFSATEIGNYITNHLAVVDSAFLTSCISIGRKKENQVFIEIVLAPAARACYAMGQVTRAFGLLQEVIADGNNQGTHNTTLALWALDQGKPDVALIFLGYALNQKSPLAAQANALTLAESGKLTEAIAAWDTLSHKKDSVVWKMAQSMMHVLSTPASSFQDLSEKEKYQFIHYRIPLEDSVQFDRLMSQMRQEDLKARVILDRSKKWFVQDDLGHTFFLWQKLQGLHISDARLFGDIKYFELQLQAAQGQWPSVEEQIKKGILFGPYHETERVYFEALKQAEAGDTLQAAKNFRWLSDNNPYFDEGVVAAAAYFQHHGGNSQKVYHILSEALQVNPNSVKILKAYIPVAWARGYDEFSTSALQTLKTLIFPTAYRKFVRENQLLGVPLQ